MLSITHHTYPVLIGRGGRLARCQWEHLTAPQAVAATISMDPEAVVTRASDGTHEATGLLPGGIG